MTARAPCLSLLLALAALVPACGGDESGAESEAEAEAESESESEGESEGEGECMSAAQCRVKSPWLGACVAGAEGSECVECATGADCADNPDALGPTCTGEFCTCESDLECQENPNGSHCEGAGTQGYCGCLGDGDCEAGRHCGEIDNLDVCVESACDAAGGCTGCDDCFGCQGCAADGACAELNAMCDAEPDCGDFLECANLCKPGDDACYDDCAAMYPDGVDIALEYVDCILDVCSADCG